MKKFLILASLLTLVACETQQKINYNRPNSGSITQGSTFNINVTGNPTADANQANIMQIRKEIISSLIGNQVFSGIATNPNYNVEVKLTNVETVSGVARVALGVFAGRNRIEANISVKDSAGNVLKSFNVTGESASHPFSGNSSFDDAVRAFADQVAKGIM
jgi:uncharacterized lipoprotein YajG